MVAALSQLKFMGQANETWQCVKQTHRILVILYKGENIFKDIEIIRVFHNLRRSKLICWTANKRKEQATGLWEEHGWDPTAFYVWYWDFILKQWEVLSHQVLEAAQKLNNAQPSKINTHMKHVDYSEQCTFATTLYIYTNLLIKQALLLFLGNVLYIVNSSLIYQIK